MYVWMDGWMDGWIDGCMHACMQVYTHFSRFPYNREPLTVQNRFLEYM